MTQAVNLLVRSGCLLAGRAGYERTAVSTPEAVARARSIAASAERVDLTRMEMMRSYAEGGGCRCQTLLGYFGDHLPQRCGNCDLCGTTMAAVRASTNRPSLRTR